MFALVKLIAFRPNLTVMFVVCSDPEREVQASCKAWEAVTAAGPLSVLHGSGAAGDDQWLRGCAFSPGGRPLGIKATSPSITRFGSPRRFSFLNFVSSELFYNFVYLVP